MSVSIPATIRWIRGIFSKLADIAIWGRDRKMWTPEEKAKKDAEDAKDATKEEAKKP